MTAEQPAGSRRAHELQAQISCLAAALAHYQQRFEHMPDGFAVGEVVLDAQGNAVDYRYLDVNTAFCQASGLSRDIVGRPSRDWAPQQEPCWREQLCGVATGGEPRRLRQRNADTGHHFDICAYSPAPGQFALLYRDLGGQRLADRADHSLEMIENLPGLIWTAGPDGRIDYLSPQWRAYTGQGEAGGPDQDWRDAIHPDDINQVEAGTASALQAGHPYRLEFRLRRHDGAYRWFCSRGHPLPDRDGRIVRWSGICTDIEELKAGQLRRASAERRYTTLFNNHIHAIAHCRVITDDQGNPVDYVIEDINQTYENVIGMARDKILGQRVTRLFPDIRNDPFDYIGKLGRVGLDGGEGEWRSYFAPLGRWFNLYAYSPEPGTFTALFTDVTAQKQAEDVLRSNETQLVAAFNQAAIGMAHATPDGRWLRINHRYCEMLGYEESELLGLSYQRLTHPDDLDNNRELHRRSLEQNEDFFSMEKRYLRRDRSTMWARVTVSVVRDQEGQHIYNLVLAEDITARKVAEEGLRQSAAEARATFEQAGVGIHHMTPEGFFIRCNPRFCTMVGYSEAELAELHIWDIAEASEREALCQLVATTRRGDHPPPVELRYRRKDGELIWVRLTLSAVHDPDSNAFQYAICIVEDITERKRDRMVLEGLFLKAGMGLAVVAPQGHVSRANHRFCEIVGYEEDELQRLALQSLVYPDDLHDSVTLTRQLWAGEIQEFSREIRYLRKDGRMVWCMMTASLAREADTSPFLVAVIKDITERKRLEHEVEHAKYELELRVEERTRELRLAWQQAEEGLRAAEQASRLKSEFLATLSHEIRTPLNGVIGFNGMLLDSPLNDDQRRYADLARQSGEALMHVLNDFLDYSKIEAGYLELELTDFDPHLELGQVLSLVSETARQKGLEVRHSIAAPHHLRGDVGRLRQILLNLLSNSVKFTEAGYVELHCTEPSRQGKTVWLSFQVRDSGIGIEPEVRERLFKPFSQADASTTRRYGGTGLGLAICKRLCEAMGGRIGYRSRAGDGSTFWVELPFEQRPVDGLLEPAPSGGQKLPEGGYHGRVLVAEDNPVSQQLASTMLSRLGCRVDVVGNGQEAVQAVQRLPYDLILMDCDMPVMNGLDATEAIRALPANGRRIPIIAFTASALFGDREKCMAAGMDDFLAKPVRLAELAQKLRHWLPTATA